MKVNSFTTILGLVAALSLITHATSGMAAANVAVAADSGRPGNGQQHVPDQYIVVLKDGISPAAAADRAKAKGAEVAHVFTHALKGFAIKAPAHMAGQLRNDPAVAYVELDFVVQIAAQMTPAGINRVDADLSSALSGDGAGTVSGVDVAVIDTGIDLRHPDLSVYKQKTFVKGTKSASDDNGHGTHVAGTAAAKDNGSGVVGVAPGARLWAIKVLDRNGSGSMSGVIAGIDYVTQNAGEIDVANISLGCECVSASLNAAISNSVAAGVTYVVAAGNSGKDASTFSPANHPDVIAVSAIADSDGKCGAAGPATSHGADDTLATFSNFGPAVDMAAPGVNILSTYKGGSYATMSGTSMASPHVAGAAALYKVANPLATPAQVLAALQAAGSTPATACDGNGSGYFSGDADGSAEPLLYARPL